jgi:hypothetical protein
VVGEWGVAEAARRRPHSGLRSAAARQAVLQAIRRTGDDR